MLEEFAAPNCTELGVCMDDRISESIRGLTQRNQSVLIRSLAEISQKRAADLIGVSTTTMSDMKSEHLERFSALCAACGLKLVPVTHQTHDESYIGALKTLAAVGLGREPIRSSDE